MSQSERTLVFGLLTIFASAILLLALAMGNDAAKCTEVQSYETCAYHTRSL